MLFSYCPKFWTQINRAGKYYSFLKDTIIQFIPFTQVLTIHVLYAERPSEINWIFEEFSIIIWALSHQGKEYQHNFYRRLWYRHQRSMVAIQCFNKHKSTLYIQDHWYILISYQKTQKTPSLKTTPASMSDELL